MTVWGKEDLLQTALNTEPSQASYMLDARSNDIYMLSPNFYLSKSHFI